MSGGGSKTKGVKQQMVDPAMYQMMFGQGAQQAIYNNKGQVKSGGTMGEGGLYNIATDIFNQQSPSGLNPLQTSALNQQANYLNSPDAYAGYNAYNQVGSGLMGSQNPVNVSNIPQVGGPGAMPTVTGAQGQVSSWAPQGIDYLGTAKAIYDTLPQSNISAAGASYSGPDYKQAADRVLSGQVDNPYLQGVADYGAQLAGDTFLRQVAPGLRSGAQMSGQYGGSRQGIAEGLAASDLQRDILGNTSNLFSGAYENAQNRMGSMAGQMAGIDAQMQMQNAQLAQQAGLANQQADLARAGLGLQGAQNYGAYNLGLGGLGLNAAELGQQGSFQNAGLQQQANLANQAAALDWSRLGQAADIANQGAYLQGQGLNLQGQQYADAARQAGAGMLQSGTQIPLQNLAALYGVGQTVQQAPWQTAGNYANLLFPQAQLGSANTSRESTQQTIGAGQAALGLGMAALGGMGGLGALGGLGSMSMASPITTPMINQAMQGIGQVPPIRY